MAQECDSPVPGADAEREGELLREVVYLWARVKADMTFSAENVPPGTWRIELHAGYRQLAAVDGVFAGTTDVRVQVDR